MLHEDVTQDPYRALAYCRAAEIAKKYGMKPQKFSANIRYGR